MLLLLLLLLLALLLQVSPVQLEGTFNPEALKSNPRSLIPRL